MANDIFNSIGFIGEETRVKEIMENIKNDEDGFGSIDFDKVISMPEAINITEYEWCLENWGTKCNACEFFESKQAFEILFSTAWSAPHPILKELARMYPDVEIAHEWEDWESEEDDEDGYGFKLLGRKYKGDFVSDIYYPVVD